MCFGINIICLDCRQLSHRVRRHCVYVEDVPHQRIYGPTRIVRECADCRDRRELSSVHEDIQHQIQLSRAKHILEYFNGEQELPSTQEHYTELIDRLYLAGSRLHPFQTRNRTTRQLLQPLPMMRDQLTAALHNNWTYRMYFSSFDAVMIAQNREWWTIIRQDVEECLRRQNTAEDEHRHLSPEDLEYHLKAIALRFWTKVQEALPEGETYRLLESSPRCFDTWVDLAPLADSAPECQVEASGIESFSAPQPVITSLESTITSQTNVSEPSTNDQPSFVYIGDDLDYVNLTPDVQDAPLRFEEYLQHYPATEEHVVWEETRLEHDLTNYFKYAAPFDPQHIAEFVAFVDKKYREHPLIYNFIDSELPAHDNLKQLAQGKAYQSYRVVTQAHVHYLECYWPRKVVGIFLRTRQRAACLMRQAFYAFPKELIVDEEEEIKDIIDNRVGIEELYVDEEDKNVDDDPYELSDYDSEELPPCIFKSPNVFVPYPGIDISEFKYGNPDETPLSFSKWIVDLFVSVDYAGKDSLTKEMRLDRVCRLYLDYLGEHPNGGQAAVDFVKLTEEIYRQRADFDPNTIGFRGVSFARWMQHNKFVFGEGNLMNQVDWSEGLTAYSDYLEFHGRKEELSSFAYHRQAWLEADIRQFDGETRRVDSMEVMRNQFLSQPIGSSQVSRQMILTLKDEGENLPEETQKLFVEVFVKVEDKLKLGEYHMRRCYNVCEVAWLEVMVSRARAILAGREIEQDIPEIRVIEEDQEDDPNSDSNVDSDNDSNTLDTDESDDSEEGDTDGDWPYEEPAFIMAERNARRIRLQREETRTQRQFPAQIYDDLPSDDEGDLEVLIMHQIMCNVW